MVQEGLGRDRAVDDEGSLLRRCARPVRVRTIVAPLTQSTLPVAILKRRMGLLRQEVTADVRIKPILPCQRYSRPTRLVPAAATSQASDWPRYTLPYQSEEEMPPSEE